MNEIYCGDIRDIAKTLPAQSVNCIVTSPPYFGLRNYGTAEWEGGKAECDHKKVIPAISAESPTVRNSTLNCGTQHTLKTTAIAQEAKAQYRDVCPKCGAKRIDKQIGLEESPEAYVETLVGIFRELKRVLRDDGSVWLNLGDSYAGGAGGRGDAGRQFHTNGDGGPASYKHNGTRIPRDITNLSAKNLIGIPWRVAFALQADGWILRSDIIWHKKNPMPESVTDRPTKAHEYIFLLSKKPRYYYDNEAVREKAVDLEYRTKGRFRPNGTKGVGMKGFEIRGGIDNEQPRANRNRRTVWTVSTRPFRAAHFAVFPPDLIRPCILAGCPQQVCGECGEPWVRVVKQVSKSLPVEERHGRTGHNGQPPQISGNYWTGPTTKASNEFQPVCNCNAGTTSGVVLDPFIGSGTVAQVAIETGRNWLGVELNPEYIELANKRIAQTQPPLPIEAVL